MTDIFIEVFRAIMAGGIVFSLLKTQHVNELSNISGWRNILTGFALIFFGTLIDITDNFTALNRFVIIGDTEAQAFLEKVVGYALGFLMLALGIRQWLPKVVEHGKITRHKHNLELQAERVIVLRATMRTVHDIVNNFLNQLTLFQLEAEENHALNPKSLELMDTLIQDTSAKLKTLGDLELTPENLTPNGINYELKPDQECADIDSINPNVRIEPREIMEYHK
ncbi:hypothetical protein [Vibrio sp. CAU 1672]|uniref:hypothetical protein n=1 Tax=Vibrio sp. CAU 1672 TaxID=3032594 RepID=UPI0023DBEE65|nr:hypothetical protein [Vibrio sp. CAU 1672]MDF2155801.1 hypothetical protein [Vibrio sp. CAU 1672]